MDHLEWLDRPIAFHRCFVPIAGGVAGAVFLSQLLYWSKRISAERDGWIWKTGNEWEEETGLRRGEQEAARKKLRSAGVLEEELKGVPARLHFRLNTNKLASLLDSTNKVVESSKQVCRNTANKFVGIQQTNTDTTSKNTSQPQQNSGGSCDLILPATSPTEQKAMAKLVNGLDCNLAQQILDEVAGNILAGTIRKTSSSLCRALVNLAKRGEFTQELGNTIADERDRASRTIAQTKIASPTFTDSKHQHRGAELFPTLAARIPPRTKSSALAESVCE